MLKDFLTDLTSQYHDLGHDRILGVSEWATSPEVNTSMDAAAGLGHRLVEGHDFHGLMDACEISGIPGAVTWFDHMSKDFTSHDGIPIPGAMAVKELTGMNFSEAVDWLCINAGDVLELGAEVAILKFLEKKCQDNPRIQQVALALAGVIGFVDDNPLVLVYTAIKAAHAFRLLSPERVQAARRYGAGFLRGVEAMSVGAFVTVSCLDLIGVDVFEVLSSTAVLIETVDLIDGVDGAVDVVEVFSEGIDAFTSFGLGILLSRGVKYAADKINGSKREKINDLNHDIVLKNQLRSSLKNNASPVVIMDIVQRMRLDNSYHRRLA